MSVVKRTMEEWRALLAQQRASGQTQVQWCEVNGINPFTLRERASQLRRQDREAAGKGGLRDTVSGGWVEIKPKRLPEAEDLPELKAKPGKEMPVAAKGIAADRNAATSEAVSDKNSAEIRITRGDWTVTVRADFSAELLTGVLRAVNQACC
jgi:hypothetical protein